MRAFEQSDWHRDNSTAKPAGYVPLDVIPTPACILDGRGLICASNAAWKELITATQVQPDLGTLGTDFVAACEQSIQQGGSYALASDVRRVLSNQSDVQSRVLSRRTANGRKWLQLRVARLPSEWGACIITCEDITARRRTELNLQRFRTAERTRRRQAVQYALLAHFGQFALENPPLQELAAMAIQTVQKGLGVELSRLLQAEPDTNLLTYSAGCGWDNDWTQDRPFDAVTETEDRFILGMRESVVIEDFLTERRFRPSPVLEFHSVRSAVEVLVCGARGTYGIIGAYSQEPQEFSADSANFMQNVSNTLAAFIERKATEDRLSYMAQFDSLTGLPNRNLYLDRLGHTLIESARDRLPVAVLFVDIDRFKSVNDTYGHAAGDALLVKIAERLQSAVRLGDSIGRLSGDEFAVALAHLRHEHDAGAVAQKIVNELAAPFSINDHSVYVSASVGISLYPSDGTDPGDLLKNADVAMYRAKQSGRNAYQFYLPQMHSRAIERLRLETELRGALDRDEYELYYQPKIDLATQAFSGIEALLRWRSPERGLVSPGEFISVLEEAGLITAVGIWVIATVCAQIVRWQAAGLKVPPVAINLSARQFRQQNLAAIIGQLICDSGVDPQLLEFELTESMLMSDAESAVETLQQIKARGIRLALDDFGTGYSSLSYLKRFPLDALKIDRVFIRDLAPQGEDASIVLAIINLARSLKLRVIAEGVETAEQLALLRKHDCDEAQGYFIAHPMDTDSMSRLLRDGLALAPR